MSESEYSLLSYGQFEKMTFFPPDPLVKGQLQSFCWIKGCANFHEMVQVYRKR